MLVAAAAIIVDGRVLAGLRTGGGWEFPGGKVEPGEDVAAALVRECHEELAVDVDAVREIGSAVAAGLEIRLWLGRLVAGTPTAGADHSALRWVGADDLDALAWLDVDRELLPAVRSVLSARTQ